MDLASAGLEVTKLFRDVKQIESVVGDATHEEWPKALFAAEADRFELWAVNMGLFVSGHGSLDYRVREAEALGLTLLTFVSDLRTSLVEVLEYCAGEHDPQASQDSDDLNDALLDLSSLNEEIVDERERTADSDMELLLDSVRDPIDRLYKLSTKIRNPASRFESSKALRYQKIDTESKVDLLQAFENFDYDYIRSILLQYRKANAIKTSPASEHPEVQVMENNTDQVWEPIRSILLQFQTDISNNTESFLVRRIALANVRRRRQFAYWRKHRDKLAQHARSLAQPVEARRETEPIPPSIGGQQNQAAIPRLAPEQSITTATRLNMAQLTARDDRSMASVSEYAPSTQVNMDQVDFPPAPKREANEKFFECPYCFTLCSTGLLSKNAWKAHLIHDLRPYVCTYEDCKNPDQLYDTRKDWIQHENLAHRTVWCCPEHPSQYFDSLDEYRRHLDDGHIENSREIFGSLVSATKSTLASADRCCPVCLVFPESLKELQSHIALHLERFAVFSLPRCVEEEDDDLNEGGSQNVNVAFDGSRDDDTVSDLDIDEEEEGPFSSAASIARQRWQLLLDRICQDLGFDRGSLVHSVSIQSPLRNMQRMASENLAQGRLEEAEELFTEILDVRRRTLGQEHKRTLASMSDLATVYELKGQLDQAAALRAQVVDTQTRLSGINQPERLLSVANLAVPYRNQGWSQESEALESRLRQAEEVQRTLMTRESVLGQEALMQVSQKDDQARLFDAVRTGNEPLVKVLLATEGVSPDAPDSNLRTPLSWAAGFGDSSLTKLLLATEGVDPDSKDSRGQTPLSWAADCGHDVVVGLLLANEHVNPDSKDASGWTPLAWAASKGYELVVQLLLDKEGVDPDSKSLSGLTPLAWAAVNGYKGVVELLLNSGRVDATYEDSSGQTPLSYAEKNGHEEIVELLESYLESLEASTPEAASS